MTIGISNEKGKSMSDKKIVICDCDHNDVESERKVLKAAGYEFDWLHCKTQDEVIENCKEAVVLMNQYVRMDRKIFEALPNVKCIVRYGVGVDNVNLADADEFGVQICNVPDYGTREVADQALALMMCLTRKVAFANKLIHKGIWDYRKEIPIYRMSEMTVGIYGIGRIGNEFAKRVYAMGCKVIAYDIEAGKPGRTFPEFVKFVSQKELIERADIISIHCPLNRDTYHVFGKEQFQAMKKSAYIINVARGGIIDEDALQWALSNQKIAGAALDVVEHEPMTADNPLMRHDNFIISPHTAWYSEESAEELNRKVAEEAVRFMNHEPVHYPVNLKK